MKAKFGLLIEKGEDKKIIYQGKNIYGQKTPHHKAQVESIKKESL